MSYYNSPKQYEDATGKRFTKKNVPVFIEQEV